MEGAAAGPAGVASPVLPCHDVRKVKHPDGSKTINGFRVLERVGLGSFGKVKLCERESTGEQFALKVFRKGRLRRQRDFVSSGGGMKVFSALDKVYREVALMGRLNHSRCIRLYAIFDEPQVEGQLYLVIEYAAGGCAMEWDASRRSFMSPSTKGLIPEEKAALYTHDTLSALVYLHSLPIAHRDVKPQNLLVVASGRVKLGDFGTAVELPKDCIIKSTEGTYHFYSPEMCRPGYTGHDARRADIWAAGVTLWAFLYGSVPFFRDDLMCLLEAIGEAQYQLPADPSVSSAGRAFLERMLAPEPSHRPFAAQLLEDSWLRPCLGEHGAGAVT